MIDHRMGHRRSLEWLCRLSAVVLLPLAASCTTFRPLPGVGFAQPRVERLGHARLTLRDGTELELADATISPDSITGLGGTARARYAVARSEVARVDRRSTPVVWPFLAGVLAPIAFALLYAGVVQTH